MIDCHHATLLIEHCDQCQEDSELFTESKKKVLDQKKAIELFLYACAYDQIRPLSYNMNIAFQAARELEPEYYNTVLAELLGNGL